MLRLFLDVEFDNGKENGREMLLIFNFIVVVTKQKMGFIDKLCSLPLHFCNPRKNRLLIFFSFSCPFRKARSPYR